MTWQRFANRKDVDVTTVSGLDEVFFRELWEFVGKNEEVLFTYFNDKTFTHYVAVPIREFGRHLYKKYFSNIEQLKEHHEKGLVIWKQLDSVDVSGNLQGVFKRYLEQYRVITHIYSMTSFVAIESWEADCNDMLERLMKKRKVTDPNVVRSIFKPWKEPTLQIIQKRLREGKTPQELTKEFQFLRSWAAVWYDEITPSWFSDMEGIEEPEQHFSQDRIIEMLHPDDEELAFIELAPFITFFKDWRDDLRRKHAWAWTPMYDRIAAHFTCEHDDIGYLTLTEIEEALEANTWPAEEIEYRKHHPFVVGTDGEKPVVKRFEKQYADIIASTEREQGEVRGTVAHPGKVQGPARIITDYHDMKHTQEGDVLIANTTHPNFLPAMQKAVAFVTNEGGMVSHAAIVAREMKKPCIVGTKNATKSFRDGDLVEVDADKGVVRKV